MSIALLDLAGRGDHSAFGLLARRHRGTLEDYLVTLTGSEAISEELVAETFMRAWDLLTRGERPVTGVGPWLVMIAHEAAVDLMTASHGWHELASDDLRPFDQSLLGAEETVLATWSQDLVRDALRLLSDVQRDVLVKRFYDGMTISEVARHLGRTEGAVKQLQHRGVRRLGRLLPGDVSSI